MLATGLRTEIRKDPAPGRWVLVRHGIPRPNRDGACPFCPGHEAAWEALPADRLERTLGMYRERVADLYRDPQIRAFLVLRRERTPTDRITHPFSRILGAPIIFDDLRQELVMARTHFA